MTGKISLMKLLLCLSLSWCAFAQDALILEAPAYHQVGPNRKQRVINWLHFRNSPKYVGENDPSLPKFVKYKPSWAPLPFNYILPEDFVVEDDELDLHSLTPKLLENLDDANLKKLLVYLASVPTDIKYSDKNGKTVSGRKSKLQTHHFKKWESSNAAAAIAFTMATQHEMDLFIRMAALYPEAIFPSLHGHLRGIIDPVILAEIMAQILISIDEAEIGIAGPTAKNIGLLVQYELRYWVAKDARKLGAYLAEIVDECVPILEEQELKYNEKAIGLLLGSVIAGCLMHVDRIKQVDERRIWIVGVIANLIWAATSFVGIIPVSAPVAAAIGGGISFGAVVTSAVYTVLNYPRDYFSNVREIEGRLEMAILEADNAPESKLPLNYTNILKWMRAAIHSNGQHD